MIVVIEYLPWLEEELIYTGQGKFIIGLGAWFELRNIFVCDIKCISTYIMIGQLLERNTNLLTGLGGLPHITNFLVCGGNDVWIGGFKNWLRA